MAGPREEQKRATRVRILDAAADLLAERGYSALSTLGVQRAAGISRGALLHHFPTIGALVAGLVAHLVARNEAAVREVADRLGAGSDPVVRTLTALYESMTRPAAQAEFELWAAARTDPALAEALRAAERQAGRDLHRVVDTLFGPEVVAHPRYPAVRDLTVAILRGTAMSRPLRSTERAATATIDRWAEAIVILFTHSP
ncbi:TetR/AcrR family transcriptional regulator [Nocardia sp. NBC_00508]|uniref:TetR/AcrR family transcriptional regulator n=1 Tax=Nocardia sp. NBC_00508 TaxID=2975992 RepID=UPI002E801009|nr:TetR/AcrR family transcriptional regulator [Nocardia sp. NBC_00508]WUD68259.1 TetR/AcrR family transcriptional regulator [Nocardia sp. NBC_00508]